MPPPLSQPVPTRPHTRSTTHNTAGPSTLKGASPMSYGHMSGISFANGSGFSLEKSRSMKMGNGVPGSYGARFYGDAMESPLHPFSTSITMGESSFAASPAAFNLTPSVFSSSFQKRSYAAAARGGLPYNGGLSTSFASMSFQPMSLGTSFSKTQVHSLIAQSRPDAALAKSYECCGETHKDLHALLEHVEDAHPFDDVEMNGYTGFSPITHAMDLDMDGLEANLAALEDKEGLSTTGSTQSSQSPPPVPNYPLPPVSSKPSTPPETASPPAPFPLSISDVLKSPPDMDSNLTAAISSALTVSTSSPPAEMLTTPSTSSAPSPVFAPKLNNARAGFMGSTAPRPAQQKRFDRAFNEVVAGKSPTSGLTKPPTIPFAVAPGVLFSPAAAGSMGIPAAAGPSKKKPATDGEESKSDEKTTTTNTGVEQAMPQPSLFSVSKPWRCPNPGCNKAYKQSNGLKYHQEKGQCDFALHDAGDIGLSVEEAEEKSRPFICAVGAGCKKRYRQMNGLKYHYLNSGEHGQYGLRMLQNGTHPQPTSIPGTPKKLTPQNTGATPTKAPSTTNTVTPTRAAPYTVPSKAIPGAAAVNSVRPGPNGPRMGVWPSKSAVNGSAGAPADTAAQKANVQLPSQRGRDAVLFAAVGNDPLDVTGRIEI